MGSSEVDKSGEENEPKTPPPPSSAPVTSQVCILLSMDGFYQKCVC